jgi:hypothetical protein
MMTFYLKGKYMSWEVNRAPFDQNRTPAMVGVASTWEGGSDTGDHPMTIVPVAVDPANGAVLTELTSSTNIISEVQAVYNSTPPTLTNGQTSPLQLDSSGRLITNNAPLTGTADSIAINDGTNTANVAAIATGQNALKIAGANSENSTLSAVPTIPNDLVPSIDVSAYADITLQVTGTWTGTWQVQWSNDNFATAPSTFASVLGSSSLAASTFTTNATYRIIRQARYMRIRCTMTGTGTTTGVIDYFTTLALPPSTVVSAAINGTWTVGSNSATGSAYPANGFGMAVKALTTSPTAASTGNLTALTADVMGEALVATGGLVTTAVPANASNVVVKGAAGRLCNVLITATGVTSMVIYDNATTNSGTVIGAIPASPTVGNTYNFSMPAANGITIAGSATNPAITVSWI